MDFWTLPPEINSVRIYTGAGSYPLLTAAASWDAIASGLMDTAQSWRSITAGVSATWTGPSSIAMSRAATAYSSWLISTALQAERTANQARVAAAAFEAARVASVHPALVFSNREQLQILNATNLLGQNTPAIMALEAEYLEMWAQDIAAMAGYQTAAEVTTRGLPPFNTPPQLTNSVDVSGGKGAEGAAGTAGTGLSLLNPNGIPIIGLDDGSLLGQYLQAFLSSGPYEVPISLLSMFNVLWAVNSPSSAITQVLNRLSTAAEAQANVALRQPMPTPAATPITASMGTATSLGRLLAPNWTRPFAPVEPTMPPNVRALPAAVTAAELPMPLPAPIPAKATGTPAKQPRPEPDYGQYTAKFVSRPPAGG